MSELNPDQAVALGIEKWSKGLYDIAEPLFRAAAKVDPDNAMAQFWTGHAAFERKNLHEALYRFDRTVRLCGRAKDMRRQKAVAHSNKAMMLSELGHNDEAEAELRLAVALAPDAPIAWTTLANVLIRLGRRQEGIEAARRAGELDPKSDLAHFNAGIALYEMDRLDEAVAEYRKAIAVAPDGAESTYNLAIALLKRGDLDDGFKLYDARLSTLEAGNYSYFKPSAPRWTGQDLAWKTLLIHSEQGIGDTIMFLRYVEALAQEHETTRFIVVPHSAVFDLCREEGAFGYRGGIEVHPAKDEKYPAYDYYTLLMSVPGVTGMPVPPPWNPKECGFGCSKCETWQRRIGGPLGGERPNVGICWSGNAIHKNDRHRSMLLDEFAPIVRSNPGIRFHCIQKEVRDVDLLAMQGLSIVDHRGHLDTMHDTAHLIGWMDLVVSVDTSVAHLAATMGQRTWIMLPKFRTDWRWRVAGKMTPWYPTATLWRQPTIGDWDTVVKEVAAALPSAAGAELVVAA